MIMIHQIFILYTEFYHTYNLQQGGNEINTECSISYKRARLLHLIKPSLIASHLL